MTRPTSIGRTYPRVAGLGIVQITIGDLLDVDLSGLADGYVIIWDAGSETWVVGPMTGSGGSEFPRPLMAEDAGNPGYWYVVVDGDGNAVMITG